MYKSNKFNKIILVLLSIVIVSSSVFFDSKDVSASSIREVKDNIKDKDEEIDDVQSKIDSIKEELSLEVSNLEEYTKDIHDLDAEIEALNVKIAASEENISALELVIEEKGVEIEVASEKVKASMVNSQSQIRVNGYIEFLMGASDFSDMLRRFYGYNKIKEFNDRAVTDLQKSRLDLQESKKLVEDEVNSIKEDVETISYKLDEVEDLKVAVEKIITSLRAEEVAAEEELQSLNEKRDNELAIIKELERQMELERLAREEQARKEEEARREQEEANKPSNTSPGESVPPPYIPPSGGFSNPLGGSSYYKSADVWNYPSYLGGAPHMGVDLAVSRGAGVKSVGSGMVVATNSGCAEGNRSCGGGYGNYVSALINVNGHNYGVLYGHLGSVSVSRNQSIFSGDTLGYSGNTGTSTGPHLHVELIDMGGGSLSDAWSRWNGTIQFGTGSSSGGGRRCDSGFSSPCRLNPGNYIPY